MSIYGQWVDAAISAGQPRTSAIDLGRDYDFLEVMLPGMAACTLTAEVSEQEAGTYFSLLGDETTVDEGGDKRADVWRLGGHRFIKIVSSVAQPNAVTIRIRGMRY